MPVSTKLLSSPASSPAPLVIGARAARLAAPQSPVGQPVAAIHKKTMPDFPINPTADLLQYVLADCRKVRDDLRQMGVRDEIDVRGLAQAICQRLLLRNCQCCKERWPAGATGSAENYKRALRNCQRRHRRRKWTRRTVCRAVRGNNSPDMPVQPGQLEGSMIWPPLRKFYRLLIDEIVVWECAACTAWRQMELPKLKQKLKARREAGEALCDEDLAILRLRKSRVRNWDLRSCFAGHSAVCQSRNRVRPSDASLGTTKWIFAADPELVAAASGDKMCRHAWEEQDLAKLIEIASLGDRWVPLPTWICRACDAPYRARYCLGQRSGGCQQPLHDCCQNPACNTPHTAGTTTWPRARRWWWVDSLAGDRVPAALPAPAPAECDVSARQHRWVEALVAALTSARDRKLKPSVAAWQVKTIRLLLDEQIAAGCAVLTLQAPPIDPAAFFAQLLPARCAPDAAARLRQMWAGHAERFQHWLRLILNEPSIETFLARLVGLDWDTPAWLRLAVGWICDRQLQARALARIPGRFEPTFPGEPASGAGLSLFLQAHGFAVSETTIGETLGYFATPLKDEWSDLANERSDARRTPNSHP